MTMKLVTAILIPHPASPEGRGAFAPKSPKGDFFLFCKIELCYSDGRRNLWLCSTASAKISVICGKYLDIEELFFTPESQNPASSVLSEEIQIPRKKYL